MARLIRAAAVESIATEVAPTNRAVSCGSCAALGFCGQAKVKGIANEVVCMLVAGESEGAWHPRGGEARCLR